MNALWKFITHDWYFFWPMFLMSVAGMTLVIWRALLNMSASTKMNEFLPTFQNRLQKDGVPGALKLCKGRTDLIPKKLFVPALEVSKQGLAASRRAMANAIELEIVPDLNYLLPTMLAIAKVATMVGLLGTVISMIGTFNNIQSSTEGGVGKQAESIGLALFATALGLVTAIPLVFAHVLFRAWLAKFEVQMKSSAQKLVVLLQAQKAGTLEPATKAGAEKGNAEPVSSKK
jgi:biopolymer transport protein ExbB